MLSLEEIKSKSLMTVRLKDGAEIVGNKDTIDKYRTDEKVEYAKATRQPRELQPFWLAYEYAINTLDRKDLIEVDDFYAEWTTNPEAYDPDFRPIKCNLRMYFLLYSAYPPNTNFKIKNYDGYSVGNHHRKNYEDALDTMGDQANFNVIEWTDEGLDPRLNAVVVSITIQSKDLDAVKEFAMLANRFAADEVFGDD